MKGYFSLTKFCNQKCISCPTKSDDKSNIYIDISTFKRNVNLSIAKGMNEICLSGGEPFCHPQIKEILCFLNKKHIKIIVLTNGLLIEKNICLIAKYKKNITIVTAIHSIYPEAHDLMTGVSGSFNNVIRNLQLANSRCINICIKIILSSKNANILKEMVTFLSLKFINPFIISISSIDLCGNADLHRDLFVPGKQIKSNLNDFCYWYMKMKRKLPRIIICEFPICLMTQESLPFLSLAYNKKQFVYQSIESGLLFFDSPYDCGTYSKKCCNCLVKRICPGFWKSTLDYLDEDINSIGEH